MKFYLLLTDKEIKRKNLLKKKIRLNESWEGKRAGRGKVQMINVEEKKQKINKKK